MATSKKKKVFKVSKFFYKYNFFLHYLNKTNYKKNLKFRFGSSCKFNFLERKNWIILGMLKFKKLKIENKILIKKITKTWWYDYKKKKKKSGRIKKIQFWRDLTLHNKVKYLVKYNLAEFNFYSNHYKFYRDNYFKILMEEKKNIYDSVFFNVLQDDELYGVKLFNYDLKYNILFNAQNQTFFPVFKSKELITFKFLNKNLKLIYFKNTPLPTLFTKKFLPYSAKRVQFAYKNLIYNLN